MCTFLIVYTLKSQPCCLLQRNRSSLTQRKDKIQIVYSMYTKRLTFRYGSPFTPSRTEKNHALIIYITLLFLHKSFFFRTSFLPSGSRHHRSQKRSMWRKILSLASAGGMLCLHILGLLQAFEELRKLADRVDDWTKLL